jgi:hypothetical protein
MAGHAAFYSSKHNGVAEVMWCSANANLSEWLTVIEMVSKMLDTNPHG